MDSARRLLLLRTPPIEGTFLGGIQMALLQVTSPAGAIAQPYVVNLTYDFHALAGTLDMSFEMSFSDANVPSATLKQNTWHDSSDEWSNDEEPEYEGASSQFLPFAKQPVRSRSVPIAISERLSVNSSSSPLASMDSDIMGQSFIMGARRY